MNMTMNTIPVDAMQKLRTAGARFLTLLAMIAVSWAACYADTWNWKEQTIDENSGSFTSIAIDGGGNLQLVYSSDTSGFRWAFRAAGEARWYSMPIERGAGFTGLALDAQGNPHVCLAIRTANILEYGSFSNSKWHFQQIDPDSGPVWYSCAIALTRDGIPHVTWYQEKGPDGFSLFGHYKYVVLKNGEWLAQTVDQDPLTGKWHSLALDQEGNPHISYDCFVNGELKYASGQGSKWNVTVVDSRRISRTSESLGMGSSLVLDSQGLAHISYVTDSELKYAQQTGDGFKVERVVPAAGWITWLSHRTSLVLDSQGHPHIIYEDSGSLKHAFRDGERWQVQVLAPYSMERYGSRFASAVIGTDDVIYVGYSDPADGSMKLKIGTPTRAISDKTALPPVSK